MFVSDVWAFEVGFWPPKKNQKAVANIPRIGLRVNCSKT